MFGSLSIVKFSSITNHEDFIRTVVTAKKDIDCNLRRYVGDVMTFFLMCFFYRLFAVVVSDCNFFLAL